jgi:cell wall-associated NlpC family hydrolase
MHHMMISILAACFVCRRAANRADTARPPAGICRQTVVVLSVAASVLLPGCAPQREADALKSELNDMADEIRRRYAPDARDEVFDIRITDRGDRMAVTGATTVAEARTELRRRIRDAYGDAVADSITLLPAEATTAEARYGVVNVSVADARTGADYAGEMATQLLLGAPVQVLQHDGWWRIRSAEGYVAWMEGGSFVRMSEAAFDRWTAAAKVIFTDMYGFAREEADERSAPVSDLVFGNLLKYEGETGAYYRVSYPDGRTACVAKSRSSLFDEWLSAVRPTEEGVVAKARTLRGIPYSWGGASTKAVDCSGFTKTVYLMHGVVLRRDASQQAETGIPVDISGGYDPLRPGDLMFFGRKAHDGKRDRIRHTAIYAGDGEFIHAGSGYVRSSSLRPSSSNYDSLNTREFIRAVRIIGAGEDDGIIRLDRHPMYRIPDSAVSQ